MSAWGDTLTEQLAHDILMDQQHSRKPALDSGAWEPVPCGPPCGLGLRVGRASSATTLATVCPAAPCRSANRTNTGATGGRTRRSWPLLLFRARAGFVPPGGNRDDHHSEVGGRGRRDRGRLSAHHGDGLTGPRDPRRVQATVVGADRRGARAGPTSGCSRRSRASRAWCRSSSRSSSRAARCAPSRATCASTASPSAADAIVVMAGPCSVESGIPDARGRRGGQGGRRATSCAAGRSSRAPRPTRSRGSRKQGSALPRRGAQARPGCPSSPRCSRRRASSSSPSTPTCSRSARATSRTSRCSRRVGRERQARAAQARHGHDHPGVPALGRVHPRRRATRT